LVEDKKIWIEERTSCAESRHKPWDCRQARRARARERERRVFALVEVPVHHRRVFLVLLEKRNVGQLVLHPEVAKWVGRSREGQRSGRVAWAQASA
jgi:hypothetical protein